MLRMSEEKLAGTVMLADTSPFLRASSASSSSMNCQPNWSFCSSWSII
jgi:hypothetical protein